MATMGEQFRAAREAKGLDPSQAAAATHMLSKHIHALENEDFHDMAPTYAKGFIRLYARFLGLDAEAFIEDYNQRLAPQDASIATQPERLNVEKNARSQKFFGARKKTTAPQQAQSPAQPTPVFAPEETKPVPQEGPSAPEPKRVFSAMEQHMKPPPNEGDMILERLKTYVVKQQARITEALNRQRSQKQSGQQTPTPLWTRWRIPAGVAIVVLILITALFHSCTAEHAPEISTQDDNYRLLITLPPAPYIDDIQE